MSIELSCDARSAGAARRFCSNELSLLLLDRPERGQLLDDATLIVSELVTNSINAGCADVSLDVDLRGHQLRIEVWDNAPGHPVWRTAEPAETSGRGLAITDFLSTACGVVCIYPGKLVWAELAVPPVLTK